MKAPIIVNDSSVRRLSGDVMVYETVESAERASEIYDVDDPHLTYFDADGRLLLLELHGDHVRLRAAEPAPSHQSMLREILKDFFSRVGLAELGLNQGWCDKASLEELVDKAREYFLTT